MTQAIAVLTALALVAIFMLFMLRFPDTMYIEDAENDEPEQALDVIEATTIKDAKTVATRASKTPWAPDVEAGARIRAKASRANGYSGNFKERNVISARERGFIAFFLHIHKGGGTTVCMEALWHGETSRLGMNCNLRGSDAQANLVAADPDDQERIVFEAAATEGLTFVASEWVLPKEILRSPRLRYFTLLRDPVQRTESHFQFAFAQQKQNRARDKAAQGTSSVDCASKASDRVLELNTASRTRGITISDEAEMRIAWLTRVPDNWQVRAICGIQCASVPFGRITQSHLQIALERLERDFDTVGVLEHMTESMQLFSRLLGWNETLPKAASTTSHARQNSATSFFHRVSLTGASDAPYVSEALEWFDLVNAWDIELYEAALALLYRALEARGIFVRRNANMDPKEDPGPKTEAKDSFSNGEKDKQQEETKTDEVNEKDADKEKSLPKIDAVTKNDGSSAEPTPTIDVAMKDDKSSSAPVDDTGANDADASATNTKTKVEFIQAPANDEENLDTSKQSIPNDAKKDETTDKAEAGNEAAVDAMDPNYAGLDFDHSESDVPKRTTRGSTSRKSRAATSRADGSDQSYHEGGAASNDDDHGEIEADVEEQQNEEAAVDALAGDRIWESLEQETELRRRTIEESGVTRSVSVTQPKELSHAQVLTVFRCMWDVLHERGWTARSSQKKGGGRIYFVAPGSSKAKKASMQFDKDWFDLNALVAHVRRFHPELFENAMLRAEDLPEFKEKSTYSLSLDELKPGNIVKERKRRLRQQRSSGSKPTDFVIPLGANGSNVDQPLEASSATGASSSKSSHAADVQRAKNTSLSAGSAKKNGKSRHAHGAEEESPSEEEESDGSDDEEEEDEDDLFEFKIMYPWLQMAKRWTARQGKGLVYWYYVKPGVEFKKGRPVGKHMEDYFNSSEEVVEYVKSKDDLREEFLNYAWQMRAVPSKRPKSSGKKPKKKRLKVSSYEDGDEDGGSLSGKRRSTRKRTPTRASRMAAVKSEPGHSSSHKSSAFLIDDEFASMGGKKRTPPAFSSSSSTSKQGGKRKRDGKAPRRSTYGAADDSSDSSSPGGKEGAESDEAFELGQSGASADYDDSSTSARVNSWPGAQPAFGAALPQAFTVESGAASGASSRIFQDFKFLLLPEVPTQVRFEIEAMGGSVIESTASWELSALPPVEELEDLLSQTPVVIGNLTAIHTALWWAIIATGARVMQCEFVHDAFEHEEVPRDWLSFEIPAGPSVFGKGNYEYLSKPLSFPAPFLKPSERVLKNWTFFVLPCYRRRVMATTVQLAGAEVVSNLEDLPDTGFVLCDPDGDLDMDECSETLDEIHERGLTSKLMTYEIVIQSLICGNALSEKERELAIFRLPSRLFQPCNEEEKQNRESPYKGSRTSREGGDTGSQGMQRDASSASSSNQLVSFGTKMFYESARFLPAGEQLRTARSPQFSFIRSQDIRIPCGAMIFVRRIGDPIGAALPPRPAKLLKVKMLKGVPWMHVRIFKFNLQTQSGAWALTPVDEYCELKLEHALGPVISVSYQHTRRLAIDSSRQPMKRIARPNQDNAFRNTIYHIES
ncbi:Hypothetical Protein FCC1311_023102 [Hondaea fermentalgiana]|uniref:Uncharacterized protein n=1 Tax=Hondaea fermentalgiana TaxID=2315210 RepID=A0A2R5G531_9STRA|nr:Hypothetical Protein FCC1311_023102 [Hondaea fermentalgiana]|eukprot:GBG26090.1 Hypothetical Protein FCC1311_023102 [Hondaea fermentalgiana]